MGTIPPKEHRLKTGETVLIRDACAADASQLLEITSAVMREGAYSVTEPDEFQTTVEEEREWVRVHREGLGNMIIVAEIAGNVVGLLNFANGVRRRKMHTGSLGLSIRREWRDKGIGRLMLESLLEWAEGNPLIEKVSLEVLSSNERAIALYRKLGFKEEGRRVREIKIAPGQYVDDILMSKFVKDPHD